MMTSQERMRRAIHFEGPDRAPIVHSVLPAGVMGRREELNALLTEFPADNNWQPYPDDWELPPDHRKGAVWTDEWGCTWRCEQEGMMGIRIKPGLPDLDDLDSYQFPPVRKEGISGIYFFETMQSICGWDKIMIGLATNDRQLWRLRDKFRDWVMEGMTRYIKKTGPGTGGGGGDDWGTQTALIISPEKWREFFKPVYAEMFGALRNNGGDVGFHTDGYTWEIIGDLIEVGVNNLNPQTHIMGNKRFGREFGGKVCITTDLDRQYLLPWGTRQEIWDEVQEMMESFGRFRGGIILRGEINADVPLENIRHMYEAFYELGKY